MTFAQLTSSIRKIALEFGFTTPTQVQKKAIPLILSGQNVLVIGPTGSGKTEAAVLPVFEKFIRIRDEGHEVKGISILFITPLRALNRDIFRRIVDIGKKNLGIDIQIRHGDTTSYQRRKQALKPPHMLITTPETLQAILPGKRMKQHLKAVKWIIIDEIHELSSSKRGIQLVLALERLLEITGEEFQRIGLSATVGSPKKIKNFLAGKERSIQVMNISKAKSLDLSVECPSPTENDVFLAKELFTSIEAVARIKRLVEHVKNHDSVLVFVNTRQFAEIITSRLRLYDPAFRFDIHHGSLSKEVRVSAEDRFKAKELKVIVCTSSLELGLDIGDVDLVIQFMSPRQVIRLVQRVGRARHWVEEVSKGIIISMDANDICESAVIAKRSYESILERALIHENALDVLCHQIAGILLDKRKVSVKETFEIITRAWPFRNLSYDVFLEVIGLMDRIHLIWIKNSNKTIELGSRARQYYYNNLSTIPDVKRYHVFDVSTNKSIGVLDEEFVATRAERGVVFIVRGRPWKIISLEEEDNKINVEPAPDHTGAIPGWEGELIPVPFEVAQEVGELFQKLENILINKNVKNNLEDLNQVSEEYMLTEEALNKLLSTIEAQIESGVPVPNHNAIVIESIEDYVIIHTYFGSRVNSTIGHLLSAILTSRFGATVGIWTDPYRIRLRFPGKIRPETIETILKELNPEHIEVILDLLLRRSSLFEWKFMHVAKRFGIIERNYSELGKFGLSRLIKIFQDTPVEWETMREVKFEKLNVTRTKRIVENIKRGFITTHKINRKGINDVSPIARPALDFLTSGDLISPSRPEAEILKAVKNRLLNKRVKLVCLYCGNWNTTRTVKSLPESPTCPKCQSKFVAICSPKNNELQAVFKRYKDRKMKLSKEEMKILERGWKSANLMMASGKKAIISMAGRGIGPTTAAKILSRLHKSENEFLKDILNAEKEYARTRAFWAN